MEYSSKALEYFDFLAEYARFFNQMSAFEKQKLDALLSNELSKIEHAIALTQANAKQLENLESKRMQLQQQAGFSQYPLRDVADQTEEPKRSELLRLLDKMSADIVDIKFYNAKSMELAQTNLKRIAPAGKHQEHITYNKPKEQTPEVVRPSLWQTKV